MNGLFITLEGIEGSGKSTQLAYVVECLQNKNKDVVCTREPGGTMVGEKIRNILLDKKLPSMHIETELMLMCAARVEHVKSVIEPALNQGKYVVCDRFFDATYAYQGFGRGIDIDRIDKLREFSIGSLQPDMTLLLDVTLDVSESRVDARGERDRFEDEKLTFYEKIRGGYLEMAKNQSARIKIIDATKSISDVQSNIKQYVDDLIEKAGD